MIKQWYHFHTPRQLRLFGDAIGQDMRDSIQAIHVQLDDATMIDEMLRFKNLVIIRILINDDRGISQVIFDNFREKVNVLRAGLPFFGDVQVQDPRDAAKFLSLEVFVNAFLDGTIW